MSTSASTLRSLFVMSSSAWLGSAIPLLGWLCARMTAAALCRRASFYSETLKAPEEKVRDFSFKFTILAAVVQSQPPTHLRVTFSDYDDKNAGAYACRRLAIYPVPLASRKLARNPGVNSSERSAQHPRLCPAKFDAARPRATSWRSSSPNRFPSRVNPTKHSLPNR